MEFGISSSKLFYLFIFGCFALITSMDYGSNAQLIPDDEVRILKTISSKIENLNWNVTSRSCTDGGFKNEAIDIDNDITRNVTCNCSFSRGKVCHVTKIYGTRTNLSGFLLSEFGYLTHLQELDLSYNSLNGSIPKSFSRLPLVTLRLTGNPISSSIPKEIGEITTLEYLELADNLLEGTLPSSIGNLKQLRKLELSGNKFSGSLPESFGNLKKLQYIALDGSSITGNLQDFIGNWTELSQLYLQGTSLRGPIPTTISQLTNLIVLYISDLLGPATMRFPNLKNLTFLQHLVLRNCSIHDSIPSYIGKMVYLSALDLSFNKLIGEFPNNMNGSKSPTYMFLNENTLSGKVPEWILQNIDDYFDLSHNNFSGTSAPSCQYYNINLASSLSSSANTSHTCLNRGLPCEGKPKYHSLFINCGGPEIEYNGNKYEEDTNPGSISFFFLSGDKWAYSSTGRRYFGRSDNKYLVTNKFSLNISGPDFYQTARRSPLSLKYHGLCMINGNYNVKLHFAEIMYSNDQNFSGLGRRIFDVFIQGRKYLRDFNIMEEAGGIGKGIVKDFNVDVNNNNLEIHLYWAGKGTYYIPDTDVNGPLISAISVSPNFKTQRNFAGAIAGIVIGSCLFLIILIIFVLRRMGFLGGKDSRDKQLLDLKTGYFSLKQIKDATNNFAPANKIGEGGFGPVYKGVLSNGVIIAVKQLSSKSRQGNREFVNEIGMISALQHPNLVKLYGCCIDSH